MGRCPAASASAPWPAATCRAQAEKVAYWGDFMVRHYGGMVYPADVAYLQLRHALERYEGHGCAPRMLGRTLRTELKPKTRSRLLALVPAGIERTLRRALAAAA